jgi:hypothetical protein
MSEEEVMQVTDKFTPITVHGTNYLKDRIASNFALGKYSVNWMHSHMHKMACGSHLSTALLGSTSRHLCLTSYRETSGINRGLLRTFQLNHLLPWTGRLS